MLVLVVKFRRTGESTRSEDECGGREEALQVEGGRTDMESVSLADGAPVPREFANPTDDTFMVEDAVEAIGFGTFQWKLSILTGLSWMADAMEMMILSILAPQLHCEWALPSWEVALLTSVVFIGMMISSSLWGNISDKYGRKTGLKMSALWTLFYGLLSAFAPVYGWILFLRALVGFGIGGAPQSLSIMSNAHQQWLPESARYDVLTGNQEKALNTLKRIATENNVPMPLGKLIAARQEDRGKIQDLFSPHFRLTTILLWFIWFSNAFSYYGVVLLTTALFQEGGACGRDKMEPGCSLECKYLNSDDYKDLLWTTLSEFPGLLVTLWAIDRLGRRKTMALCFFVFSLCIVPLYACVGRTSLTVFIFIARAFIAGGFQAAYVYTPEVYPTATRALGLGTSSGMARVGALITPFVAQVMLESSVYLTLSVYCCCCLLAAIASCALPIETTGRGLQESSHREWGQEMMRRASDHSPGGIPHSSSGSQD
uniref:Synaptic vesicle 2-related protein-like n=1 Tax=Sinocyclocheilus rhinocerous TaxID=307959 RepID=A0A673GW67_9TELE